jgi:hypothetical protein
MKKRATLAKETIRQLDNVRGASDPPPPESGCVGGSCFNNTVGCNSAPSECICDSVAGCNSGWRCI